jgi:hypothetical protein
VGAGGSKAEDRRVHAGASVKKDHGSKHRASTEVAGMGLMLKTGAAHAVAAGQDI